MSTASPSNASGSSSKQASEAAAAAAAIAAKIAAQFAAGGAGALGGGGGLNDAAYTHDIDINDARNRYMLCKSSTQQEIQEETGASISTKGTWHPQRSKATERDPPLYLHIMAPTREILDKAIKKVEELLAIDMGSLVEDKKDKMGGRRKWPEEKLPVGLESIRNFNLRAKVVGPSGSFVKYIQQETGTRVQIKGVGSGFVEQETGRESEEPLYIHITGPEESQVARAKVLTEDLLLVVRAEHAKMAAIVQAQQMELHQAQQQYAAYAASMQGGYPGGAPGGYAPPPPGEAPPPPPGGADPAAGAGAAGATGSTQEQYAAYWAAYGYDVNSPEFKAWAAEQAKQAEQYYAQQGQQPQPQGQPPGAPAAQAPGGYPGYPNYQGYDPSAPAPQPSGPPPPPPDGQAPPPPPPPA